MNYSIRLVVKKKCGPRICKKNLTMRYVLKVMTVRNSQLEGVVGFLMYQRP
jgi:hypothetical protein